LYFYNFLSLVVSHQRRTRTCSYVRVYGHNFTFWCWLAKLPACFLQLCATCNISNIKIN